MTFAEICKLHIAGQNLQFTHPDLMGIYTFDGDGQLTYAVDGLDRAPMPFWLSDFSRDDWHTV
jgi:hypothetical protein